MFIFDRQTLKWQTHNGVNSCTRKFIQFIFKWIGNDSQILGENNIKIKRSYFHKPKQSSHFTLICVFYVSLNLFEAFGRKITKILINTPMFTWLHIESVEYLRKNLNGISISILNDFPRNVIQSISLIIT